MGSGSAYTERTGTSRSCIRRPLINGAVAAGPWGHAGSLVRVRAVFHADSLVHFCPSLALTRAGGVRSRRLPVIRKRCSGVCCVSGEALPQAACREGMAAVNCADIKIAFRRTHVVRAARAAAAAIASRPASALAARFDRGGLQGFWRSHWLAVIFGMLALVIRIVFWAYTGRVWEDGYITLTAVRNVWLGHGLTCQVSQPQLFCFTSPLGVLIPLLPEGIHQGLLAMRLSSLAASVVAVAYAHRLCIRTGVSKVAEGFALAFVALDHSQVFFGMAGMETQVATAIILASAYYVYVRSWRAVGITCGLALLARPDFVLWVVPVGLAVLVWDRRAFLRAAGYSALLYSPWVIFATIYYGSPIPHTIVAKSLYVRAQGSIFARIEYYLLPSRRHYYPLQWRTVLAPFKDFTFTSHTPVPDGLLWVTSFLFLMFILAGSVDAGRRFHGLLPVVAYLGLFFAYHTYEHINFYSMWYMPPATALGAILAALGIDRVRRKLPGITQVAACAMAGLFAITVPWMMPLDRTTQIAIDQGVRGKIGMYLNRVMGPHDSVALEPLGYIGWYAMNKIFYDYPGLSSDVVTQTLARLPDDERTLANIINALHPTYAVLRPAELRGFRNMFPAEARRYHVIRVFAAPPGLNLSFHGLTYRTGDSKFFVLKYSGIRP
jgi:hypothetical protein